MEYLMLGNVGLSPLCTGECGSVCTGKCQTKCTLDCTNNCNGHCGDYCFGVCGTQGSCTPGGRMPPR